MKLAVQLVGPAVVSRRKARAFLKLGEGLTEEKDRSGRWFQ